MRTLTLALLLGSMAATAVHAAPPASTPESIAAGKASFNTNCATCHGEKMDGNGPAGQYMKPKPRHLITEKYKNGDKPEQIFKTISEGLKGTAMTGFAHIPEKERWGIVHYIISLRPAKKK